MSTDEPRQKQSPGKKTRWKRSDLTIINLIIGVRRLKLRYKLSAPEYRFFNELLLEANDVYPRFPKKLSLTNEQAVDLCAGSVRELQRIRESLAKKRIQRKWLLKYEKGDRWTKRATVYQINYTLLLSCISANNAGLDDLDDKNDVKREKDEVAKPANNAGSDDLDDKNDVKIENLDDKNDVKMKNRGVKPANNKASNEALLDQSKSLKKSITPPKKDPVSYEDQKSVNDVENHGGDSASLEKKEEAEEKKKEAEDALARWDVWPKVRRKFLKDYEPGYILYKVEEFEERLEKKTVPNPGGYLAEMITSGNYDAWLQKQEAEKVASAAKLRESAIDGLGDIVNEEYMKDREEKYGTHLPYRSHDLDFREILAGILDQEQDAESTVRLYARELVDSGEHAPEFGGKFRDHFDHLV